MREGDLGMPGFDAADMHVGDGYGHPEDLFERRRSIGTGLPDGRHRRPCSDARQAWSEAGGIDSLNRAVGRREPIELDGLHMPLGAPAFTTVVQRLVRR